MKKIKGFPKKIPEIVPRTPIWGIRTDSKCMTAQSRPEPAPPYEPLLTPQQLADWLGVSRDAVKKWMAAGPDSKKIPVMIQVNGQYRFRRGDVEAWLVTKEIRPTNT